MENITFYEQINLFLESKRLRKPLAYVRRPELVCVGLMHAYASTNLCMQLGFQKPMKNKYFALMLTFGTNLTTSGSHYKPHIFSLYKAKHGTFSKHIETPKGKSKIH